MTFKDLFQIKWFCDKGGVGILGVNAYAKFDSYSKQVSQVFIWNQTPDAPGLVAHHYWL